MAGSKRLFDFTKYKKRYIALKIVYFGWDYNGLAQQQDDQNTVEFHIFEALTKTCLIESRDKCCYNRCGRTDKGVSSSGQVINLSVRSNMLDEESNIGLFTPENYTPAPVKNKSQDKELDYVGMLNRVLPENIKVIAWAPVRKEFSSRFGCKSRSYSYIFPIGDLCVDSMRKALSYLVGEHDFRNLCSFDLKNNVTNHRRTILSATIQPTSAFEQQNLDHQQNRYCFYEIIIRGQAFLYHQIRCIMTVIFLVGSKKEQPELVRNLLDINECPSRPNYNRASPVPLCLFDCEYDSADLPSGWLHSDENLQDLTRRLKRLWLEHKTKYLMIEKVLFSLRPEFDDQVIWKDFGLECDNMSDSKYIPLLKRPRDETLEVKLENMERKKKLREE